MALDEQIAEQLRQDIVARRIAPGTRLTEAGLAERYGASRIPVREAVKQLESEGFITSTSPRVKVVAELTAHDLEDLFAVRATVEARTSARTAALGTPEQLRHIRAILTQGQEALAAGRLDDLAALNTQFHRAIAIASGSDTLIGLFNQISHKISWLYSDTVSARATSSWTEHAAIVDALIEHDVERAQQLMHAHISTSADLNLSQVSGSNGSSDLAEHDTK